MKKLGLYMVMALILGSIGCSKNEEIPNPACTFFLENRSTVDVHMWITDEDISPDNKIKPDGQRKVDYFWTKELERSEIEEEPVTVYAGRDGKLLTKKTFYVTRKDNVITAKFSGESIY